MVLNKKAQHNGFTLVEMIVVCAIIAVISAIVMFNYSDFRQAIDTRNLAEEMALTIRKAQTYATSSRGIYDSSGTQIRSFGIIFSTYAGTASSLLPYNKGFLIFAALPPAGGTGFTPQQNAFTAGGTNRCNPTVNGVSQSGECLEYFSIAYSASVTNIETYSNGTWTSVSNSTSLSFLNIMFNRPTPDAQICVQSTLGGTCGATVAAARITVTSENGKIQKQIVIWNTGQIAVQSVVATAPLTIGTIGGNGGLSR